MPATHVGIDRRSRTDICECVSIRGFRGLTPIPTYILMTSSRQNAELARAKADLERSRSRYVALFDLAPVGYFTLTRDGRIDEANAAAAELLQTDATKLVHQPLTAYLDPVSARNFQEHLERVFAAPSRHTVAVKFRPLQEGGLRHVMFVSRMIDSELTAKSQCLSACFDLTEQQRAEEAKKQLERQLVNTQRLESLGQLAGGIAHDFNNLLTGVLGHAELLEMSNALDESDRQCVTMIRKAATSAAKLCQQMLTSAGRSMGTLEAVNLNDTITDAVALIAVSLNKNVRVVQRLSPSLPAIDGDFAQLNQAILNLLINAEEAIGDDPGEIEVGSRLTRLEAEYRDASFFGPPVQPGEYVELWVSDTGMGMSPVTLSHIFDPFFTTKFTGRGLGLATVFGTVRWHNGTIGVRSAPGAGATFRIFLPVARAKAAKPGTLQPKISEARSLAGKRILLIEDEAPVRQVITSLLERAGAQVISAPDGYTALELFREHRTSLTHILLDLIMPGMTGEETLRALRQTGHPLPPVIILSGYASPDTQSRLTEFGVAGQLQKPCSIVQLSTEIVNAG
jgi:two-component system, cell cycle sensor histidine kinase and response regulator CckA